MISMSDMKRRLTVPLLFVVFVGLGAAPPAAGEAPIEGLWQTIDDSSKKPRSHVEIEVEGGVATGRITKLIDPDEPNPKCAKCDGPKKNQPIVGLEFMWGLKRKKDEDKPTWEGGKILDPENGKVYDCKIWLEDQNTLKVRGSWLMFGRTQVWHRLDGSERS